MKRSNKVKLIRDATARVVMEPSDVLEQSYLQGLCDAIEGAARPNQPMVDRAAAIARKVLIAVQE